MRVFVRKSLQLLPVVTLGIAAGCASVNPNPGDIDVFKRASAGHTGCLPEENEISNVKMDIGGNAVWNATCKGKVYLCTEVNYLFKSESFACAPVAQ